MGTVDTYSCRFPSIALLCLFVAASCVDESTSGEFDENGKPTLDGTGYGEDSGGEREDGIEGRRCPNTSFDNRNTQVWPVTREWSDKLPESGMAWGLNSGR